MSSPGPPPRHRQQLVFPAGPSGPSILAGRLWALHSPEASLLTQHRPQAPKQGLHRCRAQGWEERDLGPDLQRWAESSAGPPAPGCLLSPSASEGPHEQLVQEKGCFISINTPVLIHTLTPLLPMDDRWTDR